MEGGCCNGRHSNMRHPRGRGQFNRRCFKIIHCGGDIVGGYCKVELQDIAGMTAPWLMRNDFARMLRHIREGQDKAAMKFY